MNVSEASAFCEKEFTRRPKGVSLGCIGSRGANAFCETHWETQGYRHISHARLRGGTGFINSRNKYGEISVSQNALPSFHQNALASRDPMGLKQVRFAQNGSSGKHKFSSKCMLGWVCPPLA